MISDVLSEAVRDIREYLKPPFGYTGDPEMMAKITKVIAEMEALRIELDTPPSAKKGAR